MFEDINRSELRLGAEAGLLSFRRSAGTEQFLYVEVEAAKKDARQLKEIIMETELFSGDYDVAHPKFELRCSLPPEKK